MNGVRAIALGSAVSATLIGACQPRQAAAPPAAQQDSVRGVVSVTGTSFEQRLMLRTTDFFPLVASGLDSSALKAVAGVEIVARGNRTDSGFTVDSFTVVSVDGQAVADGILEEEQGRLFLRTAKDRQALGNPPVPLRAMIGARVWIGGPLATGPNTYGVIAGAARAIRK